MIGSTNISGRRLLRPDATELLDWNGNLALGGMVDDCISATLAGGIGWQTSTLNSGTAVVSTVTTGNHPGLYSVGTGGTTNGVGNIRSNGNNILFGTRAQRYIACVLTPAALSTGGETYEIFHGFGDATTAGCTKGAFFDYTHSLNGGIWTPKTMLASVTTTATGGTNVAVTAGAYWFLGIEVTATRVKFYVSAAVNGIPGPWTLIGISTTNIPTSGVGFFHQVIKSVGTGTTTFFMDKVIYMP